MQSSVSSLWLGPVAALLWENWAEFSAGRGFPWEFFCAGVTEVSRAALRANFNHMVS